MSTILDIHARQILDSRGNPTVEVEVPYKRAVVSEVCLNGFAYAVVIFEMLKSGGAGIAQILVKSKNVVDRLVPKACEGAGEDS